MKNEIATPFGLAMTTDDVKIFNEFVLDSEKVQIPIIKRVSIVEHGRMSIKRRVWVIESLQHFSRLFVRPQEDKDEQGFLAEVIIEVFCLNSVDSTP